MLPYCETAIEEFIPSPTYKICESPANLLRRPYAMTTPGTAGTLAARRPTAATDAASHHVAAFVRRAQTKGDSTHIALTPESTIKAHSACRVPIRGISSMLKASAPAIAPPVLAA